MLGLGLRANIRRLFADTRRLFANIRRLFAAQLPIHVGRLQIHVGYLQKPVENLWKTFTPGNLLSNTSRLFAEQLKSTYINSLSDTKRYY